jgi:hypothetical protein
MQQGYSRTSVEKAMQLANKQMAANAPKMAEKPVIKYEVIDEEELKKKVAAQNNEGFFKRILSWFK